MTWYVGDNSTNNGSLGMIFEEAPPLLGRYWVGGTDSWDGTAGTKWSETPGGVGGASVPTVDDDVFFDSNSTGTVTISTGNTGAKSINCIGFTGEIAGTANITVAGSVTLDAGQTYSYTGTMVLTGTGTLTTAGKTFGSAVVNGSGITLTLGDAITFIANRNFTISQGTFDSANYNITMPGASSFASSNSNARTINLGSSLLTLGGGVNFGTSTNLTFNAGTSQFILTGNSSALTGGSQTFYNVSFTGLNAGMRQILGANTFNDLTLNGTASGLSQLNLHANQTVNGTFTCAGSSAIQRCFIFSLTMGTTRTITANTVSANDCDFRDITIAGAAAPISPTRAGDCGGNSGINFPAAKTAFRVGSSTVWAGSSSWALTSGGVGSDDNFPLAQDTAIIDENTNPSGILTAGASYNCGALDCSSRTSSITLSYAFVTTWYGSHTLGSGVTVTGTSTQSFSGRSTMVFTSAGNTMTFSITVDAPSGTFQLGDSFISQGAVTHTRGTFNANDYNVTCVQFNSSSSILRTITMGSGLWTLSSTGTVWNFSGTNLTLNKDTADILLSNTSTSARSFTGGGLSYNKLTIGGATGTSILTINNANSFTELASTKTVAHTIRFNGNQGTIDTWSITGTSDNVVKVESSAAGTRRTFSLTNSTSGIDYLDVKDIGITQPDTFYVGSNSIDSGNNVNVIFSESPNRYWVGGNGSWNSTTKWSMTSGGASGASVPTVTENAIFDANSGAAHYTVTVTDNATCADLTFTPHASDGVTQFAVGNGFVIAGTFSTSGTQGNRRVWFRSSTEGLMRDMQIATIGTVTDVDFRDIRITGAGGTLTGTRIGDLRGNSGITFSTPKTVFRIDAATLWHDDQWSNTSGGVPNIDYFPLAQDTAVFDESTSVGTTSIMTTLPYVGSIDMSSRTSALTINFNGSTLVYGNLTFGSGVTITGSSGVVLSGRNTQVITSAGKTFSAPFDVNSYGGTVELADALNISTRSLTVTNGTFDTNGYNVTAGDITSSNSNVRDIKLSASTVTLSSSLTLTTSTNLTLDAGTSQINMNPGSVLNSGGLTFYNVSFATGGGSTTTQINGANTFNNLTINGPTAAGLYAAAFNADQTITGTLTVSGASAIRRTMLRSNAMGTSRTLTVGTLSADDCDFRDITIAGTAAGSSSTRAGDCGGNSGVNFPAPKTVYWNLAGTQNWSADGWATTSGGTPNADNFPLAQDTAVFDESGSAGAVTFNASFNIGALDTSSRTSALTLSLGSGTNPTFYGSLSAGTGLTFGGSRTVFLSGRSTQTITSNGVSFAGWGFAIDCATGTVQLADALEIASNQTLTLTGGTFDTASYNVTARLASGTFVAPNIRRLKMNATVWTCLGTGSVWSMGTAAASNWVLENGTSEIILSDNTAGARTFDGSGYSFNKLTIGGTTGTSTLTIGGTNQFTEIASTKTVAHTINFGSTTQTFGKWSVTGTAGNVVTVTGTATAGSIRINGSRVSGVDYLAMGTVKLVTTGLLASPAEFYAGANSTGTGEGIIFADAPAPVTRYWVGGTGTWDATTTNWSTTSGGAGGASVPTSADAVIFDSASSATSYTVTISTVPARCGTLTVNGPASGTVTLGSSTSNPFFVHDNITFAATGLASLFNMSGGIVLSGSAVGRTVTTNGVTITANTGNPTVDGVGSSWTLGGAANFGTNAGLTLKNGSFSTANYSVQLPNMRLTGTGTTSLSLGSSTVTMSGSSNAINFGSTEAAKANFTFDAGTSSINISVVNLNITGNGHTFYNVAETGVNTASASISGTNTFNNLSFTGRTSEGVSNRIFSGDQTINGTLTLSAGTNATMRTFVRSNGIGLTRTLTCAVVDTLTDIDFRDITIAGAAVSGGNLTGTRLGDCKGNTGITFSAGADKYWAVPGNASWSATVWATSSGGAVSNDNFPLAQDTCIFEAGSPNSGNTATINADYNIGTIDMSARTTNTMTLACSQLPSIYGNWINGTGVTLSGTGTLRFAGRGSQTITSAGVTFTQSVLVDSPSGSVTLQDAFTTNRSSVAALDILNGTFDANGYNVTLSLGAFSSSNTNTRTIAIGSGTWSIARSGTAWNVGNVTNLTVTGTGTLSFTSAGAAKTFSSGSFVSGYAGITINQGGTGQLTFGGNNTFANISSTATGATTLNFGTTTQRIGRFTATGTEGNVLTIQGSSATSPCNLIYTGASATATTPNTNYLTLTGVRAYPLNDTWYAGEDSTNNGSLGWAFETNPASIPNRNMFMLFS